MEKSEVLKSILILAKYIGQESKFSVFVEHEMPIFKIINILSYQLFLYNFNSYNSPVYVFNAHKLVLECAKEYEEKGFVNFTDVK